MPAAQASKPHAPSEDGEDHDLVVEAALFSAGGPMAIDEIVDQTGLTENQVKDALIELRASYEDRRTALDIVRSGQKWALALASAYAEQTRHIVPPEVPRHVVRTLALIAYHQPIRQSDLKDLVGSKVYEHVGHLVDAGMISKTPDGLTYSLTTTQDFPEYFGIPADEPERIRRYLAEKVGIVPEAGQGAVEQYEPEDADEPPEAAEDEQGADEEPAEEVEGADQPGEEEAQGGDEEPVDEPAAETDQASSSEDGEEAPAVPPGAGQA